MKIKYFYCFKEDNRKSMEVLGNLIKNGLKKYKYLQTSSYIPNIKFNIFSFNKIIQMRFERFISYPLQILSIKYADIAHVIDHGYSHLFYFLNAKFKIITFNDLIPILFEKKFHKNNTLLKLSLFFIDKYDQIISLSKQSKKDLIKYKKIKPNKISVIYPPVEEHIFNLKKINKKKVYKKYNIPLKPKKIIVFDSAFYKNFDFSFKIFCKLLEINDDVILIKISNYKKRVFDPYDQKIFELNNLSRIDMSLLYKSCDLLLFPSLYEGFGMPCLEAMKCGLPVVSSNNGSLKEVVNIQNRFNLNNQNKIIKHINRIFIDKQFLKLNKNISINQSKKFKEDDYYLQIHKIYQKLLLLNKKN